MQWCMWTNLRTWAAQSYMVSVPTRWRITHDYNQSTSTELFLTFLILVSVIEQNTVAIWSSNTRVLVQIKIPATFTYNSECLFFSVNFRRHRKLVRAFLINASEMLTTKGQVHVTHKTTYPYSEWDIEELAEEAGLRLLKKSPFDISEYDGYVNKKGDGSKCDKSFPVGNSCTYKFAI